MSHSLRVIGPGRAGRSLAGALGTAGWDVAGVLGRDDDVAGAAAGVDFLVIATPDAAVSAVAQAVTPVATTVVAHLAGSLALDVLAPHERRASVHPLVSLPDPSIGAARLADHAWFAIAGDELARTVVDALGGRAFTVPDEQRAAYHAAACIASNHLVALLGQVERIATSVGVPLEAYLDLARATRRERGRLGRQGRAHGACGPRRHGHDRPAPRRPRPERASRVRGDGGRSPEAQVLVLSTIAEARAELDPRPPGGQDRRPRPHDGLPARRPPVADGPERRRAATSRSRRSS